MSTATLPPPVDKSERRIRQMFGEISPRYDFLNHFLSGGTDWYWRWRTVRTAPPVGDAPILDVCSGTGDLALAYWQRGRGQIPVVGTDFTQEMLVIADRKAVPQRSRYSGQPRVSSNDHCVREATPELHFLQADTQELPFPDNQFQLVTVAFGLRNVTNTARGLREMIRVCRPGGKVVVLEFSLPGNRILRALYCWYFKNILPRIGQLLSGNTQQAYNYLPSSVSEFPYGEALAALMRECGLNTVTYTPLTCGIATLYVGVK
jgi:demethylmenaquinone methyltransferase/2-methoxy-6-polyprenyl-1,4-benzoquinol methylase